MCYTFEVFRRLDSVQSLPNDTIQLRALPRAAASLVACLCVVGAMAGAQTAKNTETVTYALRFVYVNQQVQQQIAGEREAIHPRATQLPDFTRTDRTRVHRIRQQANLRGILTSAAARGDSDDLGIVRLTAPLGSPALWVVGGQDVVPTMPTGGRSPSRGARAATADFGLLLKLTAWRLEAGAVRVRTESTVRAPDFGNSTIRGGEFVPAIVNRRADSFVDLRVGQRFVLTGVVDADLMNKLGRVPRVARDRIFKRLEAARNARSGRELVLVVTVESIQVAAGA